MPVAKEKKKVVGEKKKKKSVTEENTALAPPVPPVTLPPPTNNLISHGGSSDFEAGQLFERYNKGGGNTLEKDQFQKLLSDLKNGSIGSSSLSSLNAGPLNVIPSSNLPDQFMIGRIFERYSSPSTGAVDREAFTKFLSEAKLGDYNNLTPRTGFEAGRLFARYDSSNKGLLDRSQFEKMISDVQNSSSISNNNPKAILQQAINNKHDMFCPLHEGQIIKYYCETTASGACEICRSTGIHGGPVHRCFPLSESYRYHLGRLQNMYHAPLVTKREQLMLQICQVQDRIEELSNMRRAIERETLADCEAIVQRLKSSESFKMSLLQHDMDELQKEAKSIDRFEEAIRTSRASDLLYNNSRMLASENSMNNNVNNNNNNNDNVNPSEMIEMLQRYTELCSEAERLVAKPFKNIVDVTSDLERETRNRLDILEQFDSNVQQLQVKDHMLKQLLQQRDTLQKMHENADVELEELGKASTDEILEWQNFTEKLANELEKSQQKNNELIKENEKYKKEIEELKALK